MKTLRAITLLASLVAGITAQAATVTYTWVPNPSPPPPRNYPRIIPSGSFTVNATAVANGVILPADVVSFLFVVPSPANYFYRSFDGGSMSVDPLSGNITGGSLHSTCPSSTYGRGATFTDTKVFTDNTAGGSWAGHWSITINP